MNSYHLDFLLNKENFYNIVIGNIKITDQKIIDIFNYEIIKELKKKDLDIPPEDLYKYLFYIKKFNIEISEKLMLKLEKKFNITMDKFISTSNFLYHFNENIDFYSIENIEILKSLNDKFEYEFIDTDILNRIKIKLLLKNNNLKELKNIKNKTKYNFILKDGYLYTLDTIIKIINFSEKHNFIDKEKQNYYEYLYNYTYTIPLSNCNINDLFINDNILRFLLNSEPEYFLNNIDKLNESNLLKFLSLNENNLLIEYKKNLLNIVFENNNFYLKKQNVKLNKIDIELFKKFINNENISKFKELVKAGYIPEKIYDKHIIELFKNEKISLRSLLTNISNNFNKKIINIDNKFLEKYSEISWYEMLPEKDIIKMIHLLKKLPLKNINKAIELLDSNEELLNYYIAVNYSYEEKEILSKKLDIELTELLTFKELEKYFNKNLDDIYENVTPLINEVVKFDDIKEYFYKDPDSVNPNWLVNISLEDILNNRDKIEDIEFYIKEYFYNNLLYNNNIPQQISKDIELLKKDTKLFNLYKKYIKNFINIKEIIEYLKNENFSNESLLKLFIEINNDDEILKNENLISNEKFKTKILETMINNKFYQETSLDKIFIFNEFFTNKQFNTILKEKVNNKNDIKNFFKQKLYFYDKQINNETKEKLFEYYVKNFNKFDNSDINISLILPENFLNIIKKNKKSLKNNFFHFLESLKQIENFNMSSLKEIFIDNINENLYNNLVNNYKLQSLNNYIYDFVFGIDNKIITFKDTVNIINKLDNDFMFLETNKYEFLFKIMKEINYKNIEENIKKDIDTFIKYITNTFNKNSIYSINLKDIENNEVYSNKFRLVFNKLLEKYDIKIDKGLTKNNKKFEKYNIEFFKNSMLITNFKHIDDSIYFTFSANPSYLNSNLKINELIKKYKFVNENEDYCLLTNFDFPFTIEFDEKLFSVKIETFLNYIDRVYTNKTVLLYDKLFNDKEIEFIKNKFPEFYKLFETTKKNIKNKKLSENLNNINVFDTKELKENLINIKKEFIDNKVEILFNVFVNNKFDLSIIEEKYSNELKELADKNYTKIISNKYFNIIDGYSLKYLNVEKCLKLINMKDKPQELYEFLNKNENFINYILKNYITFNEKNYKFFFNKELFLYTTNELIEFLNIKNEEVKKVLTEYKFYDFIKKELFNKNINSILDYYKNNKNILNNFTVKELKNFIINFVIDNKVNKLFEFFYENINDINKFRSITEFIIENYFDPEYIKENEEKLLKKDELKFHIMKLLIEKKDNNSNFYYTIDGYYYDNLLYEINKEEKRYNIDSFKNYKIKNLINYIINNKIEPEISDILLIEKDEELNKLFENFLLNDNVLSKYENILLEYSSIIKNENEEKLKELQKQLENLEKRIYKNIDIKLKVLALCSFKNLNSYDDLLNLKYTVNSTTFDTNLYQQFKKIFNKTGNLNKEDYYFLTKHLKSEDVTRIMLNISNKNKVLTKTLDTYDKLINFNKRKYFKTKTVYFQYYGFLFTDVYDKTKIDINKELSEYIMYIYNYDISKIEHFMDNFSSINLSKLEDEEFDIETEVDFFNKFNELHLINFDIVLNSNKEFLEKNFLNIYKVIKKEFPDNTYEIINLFFDKYEEVKEFKDEHILTKKEIINTLNKIFLLNSNIEDIELFENLLYCSNSGVNNNSNNKFLNLTSNAENMANLISRNLKQNEDKEYQEKLPFIFGKSEIQKNKDVFIYGNFPVYDKIVYGLGYATKSCMTLDGVSADILEDASKNEEDWSCYIGFKLKPEYKQKENKKELNLAIEELNKKIEEYNKKLIEQDNNLKHNKELMELRNDIVNNIKKYFLINSFGITWIKGNQATLDNFQGNNNDKVETNNINYHINKIIEFADISTKFSYIQTLKEVLKLKKEGKEFDKSYLIDKPFFVSLGTAYTNDTLINKIGKKNRNIKFTNYIKEKDSSIYSDAEQQILVKKHNKYDIGKPTDIIKHFEDIFYKDIKDIKKLINNEEKNLFKSIDNNENIKIKKVEVVKFNN